MLMKRACASVLATIIGLISVRHAIGENLCRPDLTINEVEFSAMMPPTLERTWSAVVSVDASACTADSKGSFEIVFTRLSVLGRLNQALFATAFGGCRLSICRR